MNKQEFLNKLDSLNLDKERYCIIAGGSMLLYGLRESTSDIDIRVDEDYFEQLKQRFEFKKSLKMANLYELTDDIEFKVQDFDKKNIKFVNGYPVESLELQLKWMLEHNRPKDQEKIIIIKDYLDKRKEII